MGPGLRYQLPGRVKVNDTDFNGKLFSTCLFFIPLKEELFYRDFKPAVHYVSSGASTQQNRGLEKFLSHKKQDTAIETAQ